MRIESTEIDGVWEIEPEPSVDERGSFNRTFDADAFASAGLDPVVAQCSASYSATAGTLRGMHLQMEPHGESKLVRCTRGRIFDVVVDVRAGSPTFGRWLGWELDAAEHRAVFLSPGIAHGFLTLVPNSEVFYQMSVRYRGEAATGFRWDDSGVGIAWPSAPAMISDRDRNLPDAVTVSYREGA
jgi:dTDP-4-dehydrorhamnose 3,5-epimerase